MKKEREMGGTIWQIFYVVLIQLCFLEYVDSYGAMIDFEIERFRILDREKAAGGQRCDTDHWINRYNPCDFVFYLKNCTSSQPQRDTGCSTRINRFYAPENTDDVVFTENSRPATSVFIDSISREAIIKVEVYDQDDGYSADDPVGFYQIKIMPESIDPRGQQFATMNEQVILIPDHSELTIRFRAYCVDDECRIRRPGLEAVRPAQPGLFVQQPSFSPHYDQPNEAWTISKDHKTPSIWTGPLRSVVFNRPNSVVQSLGIRGQQEIDQINKNLLGNLYPVVVPPLAVQGPLPSSYGQRPPFVQWTNENSLGIHQPGSLISAPSGFVSENSPGSKKQHSQPAHLMGFHCENGRCFSDQNQGQSESIQNLRQQVGSEALHVKEEDDKVPPNRKFKEQAGLKEKELEKQAKDAVSRERDQNLTMIIKIEMNSTAFTSDWTTSSP